MLKTNQAKGQGLTAKGFFLILLTIAAINSFGQRADTIPYNKKRIKLIAATAGVGYAGSMIGLGNIWYSQYAHQSFRFFNDLPEWKQMDKFGHIFSAFQLASISSGTLRWGGMPAKKSDRIAAITSFLIMASIEGFDGFSAAYGASATDLLADATGSAFFLGQELYWKEIRIYPKFSFHHTSLEHVNPNELGAGWSQEWLKDYNGQTYWYSIDMDKFVRFPKWLNLCVGYGAQNMVNALDHQSTEKGYRPYRQYYIGLDFDLTAYKGKSKFLNTVIYVVNMIRLPAPALEFSPGRVKAYGFYF